VVLGDDVADPMRNYVIARVGNYVIENPSNLRNYMIADTWGQMCITE